jgi:hypothetical protein
MEFLNHTPFPALAFVGIDQLDQAFHVVVLRQTLTWNEQGVLRYAETQEALCEADTPLDVEHPGSLRQESDLCHYKPRCDVIVNASAHAPLGKPHGRFSVGLRLITPDESAPQPPAPYGLNPLQNPTQAQHQAWEAQMHQARTTQKAGKVLIDKQLTVTGPRAFVRRTAPLRWLGGLLKLITLGLVRPQGWRLTAPEPITQLPLRNELAFGGQCRIDQGERASKRIPKRHRLTPAQQAAHPDTEAPPLQRAFAHEAYLPNPLGQGWTRDWYLRAKRLKRVSAPQIEYPDCPITLHRFKHALRNKHEATQAAKLPAGLGIRAKGHPERARLVGTVDPSFIEGDAWLPEDFDFSVWNAAWPDQQTDHLKGDEIIELTNLCAPDAPGTETDTLGNTLLRLALPGNLPFVLVRYAQGPIGELNAQLDTLIVDPQAQRMSCVWRATLAQQPEVRVLEARMLKKHEVEHFKQQAAERSTRQVSHG